MDTMMRPGAAAGTADQGLGHTTGRAQRSATPRKWQRVLRHLVEGHALNRLEAYRVLRDSCLNTTVSQIEGRGVMILRREETVPGAFGPVHCCRYWISLDSLELARVLIGLDEPTQANSNGTDTAQPDGRIVPGSHALGVDLPGHCPAPNDRGAGLLQRSEGRAE